MLKIETAPDAYNIETKTEHKMLLKNYVRFIVVVKKSGEQEI